MEEYRRNNQHRSVIFSMVFRSPGLGIKKAKMLQLIWTVLSETIETLQLSLPIF